MAPQKAVAIAERVSKRKRGETSDHGFDALEVELKKQKIEAKEASGKGKKLAAGLPWDLPRVAPHGESSDPSPHAVEFPGKWNQTTDSFTIWKIQSLMDRPNFDEAGGRPFARWFRTKVAGHVPQEQAGRVITTPHVSQTWIGHRGLIAWDDLDVKAPRRRKTATWGKMNVPRPRKAIEVYRETVEGESQYFMRYENIRELQVNGEFCTHDGTADFAIGPLPAFAVIKVDTTMIFWWEDSVALEYIPPQLEASKASQVQEEEHASEEYEGAEEEEGDEDDEEDVGKEREEWRTIMMEGIQRHRAEQRKDPKVNKKAFPSIETSRLLRSQDTYLATASVWHTVAENVEKFAFASETELVGYRQTPHDFDQRFPAAVYGPNDLILPLLYADSQRSPPGSASQESFDHAEAEKDPEVDPKTGKPKPPSPGHLLFAAAHRDDDNFVHTLIMDSAPHFTKKVKNLKPHRTVRKLVRRSGWLAKDAEGVAVALGYEPAFIEEDLQVPQQESIDSCGVHTILNAWRYMLRLPPVDQTQRLYQSDQPQSRNREEKVFMKTAVAIINHALEGHMDLLTIQAFLNYFGFCGLQDPRQHLHRADLLTKEMDEKTLDSELFVFRSMALFDLIDK